MKNSTSTRTVLRFFTALLVLAFAVYNNKSYGQGTTCGAASAIAINSTTTATKMSWSKFVALGSATQISVVTTAARAGYVYVWSGTCGASMTRVACMSLAATSGTTGQMTFSTTNGTTYYIEYVSSSTGFTGDIAVINMPTSPSTGDYASVTVMVNASPYYTAIGWNNAANWQQYNGTQWVNASVVPTSSDNVTLLPGSSYVLNNTTAPYSFCKDIAIYGKLSFWTDFTS